MKKLRLIFYFIVPQFQLKLTIKMTLLCHFLEIVETLDSFIKFGRQKIETGVPRRSRVPPVSIFCSAEFNETCPKVQQLSKK